jgi:DNA-binding transcriptional regulator YiaG
MDSKPSSRPIANALPTHGGFVAQFSLPGLTPALVRKQGKAEVFATEHEAEHAALKACFKLHESRTIDTRKAGGYRRLTGAELAMLLDRANITVTYFAEIAGVPQHRVMKWLDGEQDIPHSVHILIKLIAASDDNFALAENITEQYREAQ